MAASAKTIKVCLTNRGNDVETPWAEDLGPVKGKKGMRRVRLINVPFMHAKPTWGDVIEVVPDWEGVPTWDRDGVAWEQIGTRIAEDGGRWAMIVDYTVAGDGVARGRSIASAGEAGARGDAAEAFRALVAACHGADIVCEGAWGPADGRAGRVYLATPHGRNAGEVMGVLTGAKLPCTVAQIHPPPTKAGATAVGKAKPVAKNGAKPVAKNGKAAKAKPVAAKAKPAAKAKAVAKAKPTTKTKRK